MKKKELIGFEITSLGIYFRSSTNSRFQLLSDLAFPFFAIIPNLRSKTISAKQ